MFISHVRICLKNKYDLNFKVKACHDAHISLLQIDGSTFEIVIGQMKNSTSALYKTDERGITPLLYSGQGLLDCSKFEHYFIRWSLKDLVFGQVHSAKRENLINYTFQQKNISFLNATVSTDNGATGQWIFQESG